MSTAHRAQRPDVIAGILTWWERRFPQRHAEGHRNRSMYALAAALNEYGESRGDILATCLPFAQPGGKSPFPESEIRRTVDSAIRRTRHGVKQWNTGWPRRNTAAPLPPVLTAIQERAVQDRVDAIMAERWQVIEMPPADPPPPVPAPPPPPPTAKPAPPPPLRAEVRSLLDRFPAVGHLAAVLDLDLAAAKVRPITTRNDRT